MLTFMRSLFSSPESFIRGMSRQDLNDSISDGERIIIDEDGNASVNVLSEEVHEDFARHIETLKGV